MVKYLIFPTIQDSLYRSNQIAISQGCDENSVTQYWFGSIEHSDGRAALEVTDESFLTENEVLELKDFEWMKNEGFNL
jgi:hypothetical protein